MAKLYLYDLKTIIKNGSWPTYIYFSFEPENHRIEFEPAGLLYQGENREKRLDYALRFLGKEKTYPVLLVPEPNNPHDKYAVKIYCSVNGKKVDLGYVPRNPLFATYNPPYFNYWLYKFQKYFKISTIKYNKKINSFIVTFELKEECKPAQLEFKPPKHNYKDELLSMAFGCVSVLIGIVIAVACFVVMINPKIPFSVRFVAFMFLLSILRLLGEFFD